MPTGYTATLYDGDQEFRDFLFTCARAFGALVHLRDEPLGSDLPDEVPASSYHDRALVTARERLAELRAMSYEEATIARETEHAAAVAAWEKRYAETVTRVARCRSMLDRVRFWEPPSDDHVGLRKFMIEQLESSIEHDGWMSDRPAAVSTTEWLAAAIERAERDVEYHLKEQAEDRERAEGRTRWVQQLRDSVEEKVDG